MQGDKLITGVSYVMKTNLWDLSSSPLPSSPAFHTDPVSSVLAAYMRPFVWGRGGQGVKEN